MHTSRFYKSKKQLWLIPLLGALYMLFFALLEKQISSPGTYHIITCPLDQYIPFVPGFIVFYLSWFVYVFLAFGYIAFFEKNVEFCNRFIIYLFAGMYIFLLISWLLPNGLRIRPTSLEGDGIFIRLCQLIYSNDTATNVFPSIHCFNSVAICLMAKNNPSFRNRSVIKAICFIWTVLIVLSTMFVKQHSVYDVAGGVVMGYILYALIVQPMFHPERSYSKSKLRTEFSK